jgi:2-hydroxy-3-keto-5-methylthiopentenyl-1-phosphate phosphatase
MIVFCDFDGTISNEDLLDKLVDHCESPDFRINQECLILNGTKDYNNVLDLFLKKFNISFNNAINILNDKNVIDKHFENFYNLCVKKNIPFYIVSSGIKNLITHYLPYIDDKTIFANNVEIDDYNNWQLKLFMNIGINKLNIINEYEKTPKIYIGDGLSDISIVDAVDLLFVKNNSYLHKFCINNNKKHITFNDFNDLIQIFT